MKIFLSTLILSYTCKNNDLIISIQTFAVKITNPKKAVCNKINNIIKIFPFLNGFLHTVYYTTWIIGKGKERGTLGGEERSGEERRREEGRGEEEVEEPGRSRPL